jgi:glycerol kinase
LSETRVSRTDTGDSRPLVLAIDQGTTNTKALLVHADRGVIAGASRPVSVSYPRTGWVEQDATEIWTSTRDAAAECLARAGDPSLAGIAISTQRESAVIWSGSSGQPLGPVLGWQDARTADECRALAASHGELVSGSTGLRIDPMYSASKLRWLADAARREGAQTPDIRLGTVDTWLCWNLSHGYWAEAGNASRTLLFDLETLDWAPELLRVFGIARESLAMVTRSDGDFGVTSDVCGLPAGVPIVAVMADSHAAMYAQGCIRPGQAKATYGTGSSVMTPTDSTARRRLPGVATTLAWLTNRPVYAYEGNILASGAALDWMVKTLGLGDSAELSALAETVPASDLSFVPAFTGLGAPHWDRDAVAVLAGLTAGSTRAHLARAAIEAVAHQVADVVDAVEAGSATPLDVLYADGGATASPILMQTQADLIGRPVRVSGIAEASALGAAMLGLAALGLPDAGGLSGTTSTFVPALPESDRRRQRHAWAAAIDRARLRKPS